MRQTITKTELLRKILSELGSLFLALSLAIFIWVIAENEENPVIRQNFPQKIPLEIVNLSPNLATVGNLPKEVELTVVAPSAKWNSLTPEDFRAWLDLKNKPPGRYELEVMASCSVKGVKVIETRPGRVAVTLEEKDEKEMPIKVKVLDLPPLGYYISGSPQAEPTTTKISGPKSQVARVKEVIAEITVGGSREGFSRKVALKAIDANGDEITGIKLEPASTLITLNIVQRAGFKDVSVLIKLEGQPASGFRISNVSVTPSIVTVMGSPASIEKIPGYVETEPVNIKGAKESISKQVKLNLPEGISALGEPNVLVSVEIKPVEGGITLEKKVTVQSLQSGLKASVAPETVQVILAGPLPLLAELKPEDVQVIVNLIGLGPGTYKLRPVALVPEGVRVESIIPETLEVVISKSF